MELVWPETQYVGSYVEALKRGWSPNEHRPEASLEELTQIERDLAAFVALQVDREAKGPPVILPDGSVVARLPGYRQWMWDGEFAGSIAFRWQPGTADLPPHCLGHIGYAVVPWKRGRGYATQALASLLKTVRSEGLLPYVELTTDLANTASQHVITTNGGQLVERFRKPPAYGGAESLRFRIHLR